MENERWTGRDPTGLGKLSCVLLLLARVRNRTLPTRVVYLADRRALVDQSADAVRRWIACIAARPALARPVDACAAFPAERPVALGVLRGVLADDGAWRADPARPAVVVGTVDMVGSQLLVAGYGAGRSKRPMHAGLLAHNAVVVLDEAHLSPAMDALLGAMARLQDGAHFRTLTLSATSIAAGAVMGSPPRTSGARRSAQAPAARTQAHAPRAHGNAARTGRENDGARAAACRERARVALPQAVVPRTRSGTRGGREGDPALIGSIAGGRARGRPGRGARGAQTALQ